MSRDGWKFETYDVQKSDAVRESDGTAWTCPADRVLVGRDHRGDEDGRTTYSHAKVRLVTDDGSVDVTVVAGEWSRNEQENFGDYAAPANQVLIGRQHQGDENGNTRYLTGQLWVEVDGAKHQVTVINANWADGQRESNSSYLVPANQVLTGRRHIGDENGTTTYQHADLALPE
ncbi:hypothetical protein [Streptomyces sp. NPDC051546]|uniref:hypothetical protein n=1 Tax=Streptomyces sp. NPDC051546 TaxID=3365655 RepID=UPI0037975975